MSCKLLSCNCKIQPFDKIQSQLVYHFVTELFQLNKQKCVAYEIFDKNSPNSTLLKPTLITRLYNFRIRYLLGPFLFSHSNRTESIKSGDQSFS